jgi:hypothetical protein
MWGRGYSRRQGGGYPARVRHANSGYGRGWRWARGYLKHVALCERSIPAALPMRGRAQLSLEPAVLPSLDQREAEEEYRAVGRSAVRPALSDCWEANGKGPTRDGALLVVRVSPCDPLPRRPAALDGAPCACPAPPFRAFIIFASPERASVTQGPLSLCGRTKKKPGSAPSFLLRITGRGVRFTRLGRLAAPNPLNR